MKSFNEITAKSIKAGTTVETSEGWSIHRTKFSGMWIATRGDKTVNQPSFAAVIRTLNIIG